MFSFLSFFNSFSFFLFFPPPLLLLPLLSPYYLSEKGCRRKDDRDLLNNPPDSQGLSLQMFFPVSLNEFFASCPFLGMFPISLSLSALFVPRVNPQTFFNNYYSNQFGFSVLLFSLSLLSSVKRIIDPRFVVKTRNKKNVVFCKSKAKKRGINK